VLTVKVNALRHENSQISESEKNKMQTEDAVRNSPKMTTGVQCIRDACKVKKNHFSDMSRRSHLSVAAETRLENEIVGEVDYSITVEVALSPFARGPEVVA